MSSSPTSSSSSDGVSAETNPLGSLFDIVCGVDFVIGTAQMTVGECLRLSRHSVVRLGQSSGSDFDVRVHGVSIASGEVAVVDDIAAVRITKITVPAGVGWE